MPDKVHVWLLSRKLKKGRSYHLRWRDPATGAWVNRSLHTTDKRVAERERTRVRLELEEGTFSDLRSVSWSDFVRDHCEKIPGHAHRVEARRTLTEFGRFAGGRGPKGVHFVALETYIAHLQQQSDTPATIGKKPNSPATINKKLRYISAAMNMAVRRGFAKRNPVDPGLFLPTEDTAVRVASDSEKSALLEAAERLYGRRMRALLITALGTGARRGELLNLSWDDIELQGGNPRVLFRETKSHRDRYVPLPPDVVEVLMERRLDLEANRAGGPFRGMGENLGRQWARILDAAQVKDLTFHDLRRTYISDLIRAGVPTPHVQKLAGHADIRTTLKYYTWIDQEDLRAAVAKLHRGRQVRESAGLADAAIVAESHVG